jgi:hypothetical protein
MTKEIMDKAAKALASARILLKVGDSDGATNRAYYAMFDPAIAALSWAGFGTAQDGYKNPQRSDRELRLTSCPNRIAPC